MIEYRTIPVAGGQSFAKVSPCDYELLSKFTWYHKKGRVLYAQARIGGKLVLMHRMILDVQDAKQHVDHKNHDGMDNRRENIRLCSRSENRMNQAKVNAKSGFKGVDYVPGWKNPWRAQIGKDNKNWHLGLFSTAEQAAEAYDRKAVELFGEFASTNKN